MIAILKYNAGNTRSVLNALNSLGYEACISDDPVQLQAADKVIFPGVGEAGTAMAYLKARQLDQVIRALKQPVLGICLGMQLLCAHSEEGDTAGIGIFDNQVKRFPPGLLVPHMGWNNLENTSGALFKDLGQSADFYFVHTYYATQGVATVATTDYILPFSAALQKDNFYAVQFHPEKSAQTGLTLLENFLDL
ncbi:MAG: imidazole glycerol phosphate synthase, glutamine amidotransferase subunit [Bacteroidetes bacterium 43-16]|nr:MAG: imidazole glycerol phosphate synthase, glutamine amidotransferase subunit [Bacteroidetes bacterium 43-16]